MKIAIATDDRINIAKRTGRAKEFVIYSITDGKIQNIEFKENLHRHHHDEYEHHQHNPGQGKGQGRNKHTERHLHGHHHTPGKHLHDEVVEILRNVDVLLYKALGKYMRQDMLNAKINIKRTSKEKLEEIVRDYLESN